MKYLVIYDITDDRRMRRVARTLRAYGIRVQKSAFECELAEELAARLFRELQHISGNGDSIIGYRFSAKYGVKLAGDELKRVPKTAKLRQKTAFFSVFI